MQDFRFYWEREYFRPGTVRQALPARIAIQDPASKDCSTSINRDSGAVASD
jgi:hypothetical protein